MTRTARVSLCIHVPSWYNVFHTRCAWQGGGLRHARRSVLSGDIQLVGHNCRKQQHKHTTVMPATAQIHSSLPRFHNILVYVFPPGSITHTHMMSSPHAPVALCRDSSWRVRLLPTPKFHLRPNHPHREVSPYTCTHSRATRMARHAVLRCFGRL